MPSFWLGLMLIIIFSENLRILPAFGAMEPKAIIMPSVALGVGMAARLSRLTRSAMLEVLNQDYVRTAYSKGLKKNTVVIRHALKNVLIPIVTAFGLQLSWLLGGAIIVETVFSWPGLGRLIIDAINNLDGVVVQAGRGLVLAVSRLDKLRAGCCLRPYRPAHPIQLGLSHGIA